MEGKIDLDLSASNSSELTENSNMQSGISKKQLKKLAKKEQWMKNKPQRRAKEKEKRRLKIEAAKTKGISLGPSRKMLKANRMQDSSCKVNLVFDLSFDVQMTENELSKTLKQLHRCYSINRRASAPLQIHITSFSSRTKQVIEKLGFTNWDANINEGLVCDLFDKQKIVYLTSDSPNTLDVLQNDKVYIIGALVDHNRLKGICHENAVKLGINHARLPIDETLVMKTRSVLTIDQVYHIILYVTEGDSWEQALLNVIPKRKGAIVKFEEDCSTN